MRAVLPTTRGDRSRLRDAQAAASQPRRSVIPRPGRNGQLPGAGHGGNGNRVPANNCVKGSATEPYAADDSARATVVSPGVRFTGTAGSGLLAVASFVLLLLAAAQGYVSFRAQYIFIDHAKRAEVPSVLEAIGLDTGAVIFALLALSLARRGVRATVERMLNVACALGSLMMNLLGADLNSLRSITVWVLPSALYALASDRLIAVVRRSVLANAPDAAFASEGSAWRALAGCALWLLRLILDPLRTAAGFRRWILQTVPVAPGSRVGLGEPAVQHDAHSQAQSAAPGVPDAYQVLPGELKRQALIRLYKLSGQMGDPRYGKRMKTAELAGEIALRIGYHPGTARRELAKYVSTHCPAVDYPQTEAQPCGDNVA